MAVIKIENFTGEVPRVSARALGANAQTNQNLLTTSAEFRPLAADAEVAVCPNNSVSLYRMSRDAAGALITSDAAGWIAETASKSYVKGQNNDDVTERTYVTFNDGSAAPRAIDATGQNRQLGVPKPVSLTAVRVVVDEFSTDDAIAADTTVVVQIADAIKAAMVENHYGNAIPIVAPNASTVGWLYHGTAVTGALPSTSVNQVNFCVPIVAGVMPWSFSFLRDASFGGNEVTYAGQVYFAVAVDLFASIWLPYDVALTDRLNELMSPVVPTDPLFVPAEVTNIVAAVLEYWSIAKEPIQSAIAKATAATLNIRDVIDSLDSPQNYNTDNYNTAFAAFTGPSYASAAEALKRVFFECVEYATLPGGGTVATGSRYWMADTAAAYSNLLADVNACITRNDSGFPWFDFAKFQGFLRTDFTLIINQRSVDDQPALKDALQANLDYCTQPYREFFNQGHLASLGLTIKSDAERMLAFNSAIADADAAITDLSNLGALLYSQRTTAAQNAYALGPQARISAAAVALIIENRFYVATHVTDWQEESAPCAPSDVVEMDQNDEVTLTLPSPPSGRNITHWRIYRSNVGMASAAFQYVDEVPIATQTYTDKKKSSELQEVIPSIGPDGLAHWAEPPTRLTDGGGMSAKANPYLRGLVGMPNGIMAGFVDNFVAFCDPYHPYAWPVAYQIPLEYPIVGLGVFGQTLFVGTIENPYLISGSDSASMSAIKMDSAQACVSAKSIVSAFGGVLYASPDGICFASTSGVEVVTTALLSHEDWQGFTPSSVRAALHDGVYYFSCTLGNYALDMIGKKFGRLDLAANALFSDGLSDALFYTSGTSIKKAFSTGRRTGLWKSAKLVAPAQSPLAWIQADSDYSAPVTVRWYGDGTLRHTATLSSLTPQRLPSGRYLEHEIEVESAARVTKVVLAGSTDELKASQ